jgi:enoyl-CoA hydratase
MLLTGNMISAEDAFRMGLVNKVVSPDLLTSSVTAIAREIASKSASAIRYYRVNASARTC